MIGVVEPRPDRQDRQKPSPTIKISVTRAGKDALERMAAKYGMKEQEIGGRIYEWFMAQDSIVQRAVLGLLEGLEVDAATRFMAQFAQRPEVKDKPPNGTNRIKRRKAVRREDGEIEHQERRVP